MTRLPCPKVYVPLLMILAIEFLFRYGLWENLVSPNSHSGTSIRAREAISHQPGKINYVTIGNSIPESGLDHQIIYEFAKLNGFTHVNLCMPGSHLLTVRKLTQWLSQNIPDLHGVVIGLSFRDIFFSFNGYYEINIITPFMAIGDEYWIAKQIPVKLNKLQSFGIFSNLISSREDIKEFISDPINRYHDLAAIKTNNLNTLTTNFSNKCNSVCSIDRSSYNSCLKSINTIKNMNHSTPNIYTVEAQCRKFLNEDRTEINYKNILQKPLSQERMLVKNSWQLALRSSEFKSIPLFILMPTINISSSTKDDQAKYTWAIDILKPLDEAGDIILKDFTFLFQGNNECEYFEDLVHLNVKGRDELMKSITPILKSYYNKTNNIIISTN